MVVHYVGNAANLPHAYATYLNLSIFDIYTEFPAPQPAPVLGNWGMAPWGTTAAFPDT